MYFISLLKKELKNSRILAEQAEKDGNFEIVTSAISNFRVFQPSHTNTNTMVLSIIESTEVVQHPLFFGLGKYRFCNTLNLEIIPYVFN